MSNNTKWVLAILAALVGWYWWTHQPRQPLIKLPSLPTLPSRPTKPNRRPWKDGQPVEGGKVSPDGKTELQIDLPRFLRRKNVGGRDGAGLCVFTSIEFAGKWANEEELFDLQDKMRKELGGGWPEKVTQMMAKYAPDVQYIQDTSGDADILLAILASGRMAGVTYNGHDPHYYSTIAHMVDLVHYDGVWACISDNNFIEDDQFVWMSPQEFLKRWKGSGGGWVICLLSPPPPPVPHN